MIAVARRAAPDVSEAVEDYAKAIYALQAEAGGQPVSTSRLAARLQVTAGSASAMVKKLAKLRLAEHTPYRGVILTDEGERVALAVLRHHRLLELFLSEHLDVPWERVHAEADRLEHVLSADLEARIAAKLGHPTHDPHGDPLPTSALALAIDATVSLQALAPGRRGHVARVSDTNPDMLRYLREQGINVGEGIEVLDRQPFGGPLTLRVGTRDVILGEALARAIRIQLHGRPAQ